MLSIVAVAELEMDQGAALDRRFHEQADAAARQVHHGHRLAAIAVGNVKLGSLLATIARPGAAAGRNRCVGLRFGSLGHQKRLGGLRTTCASKSTSRNAAVQPEPLVTFSAHLSYLKGHLSYSNDGLVQRRVTLGAVRVGGLGFF